MMRNSLVLSGATLDVAAAIVERLMESSADGDAGLTVQDETTEQELQQLEVAVAERRIGSVLSSPRFSQLYQPLFRIEGGSIPGMMFVDLSNKENRFDMLVNLRNVDLAQTGIPDWLVAMLGESAAASPSGLIDCIYLDVDDGEFQYTKPDYAEAVGPARQIGESIERLLQRMRDL